MKLIATAYGDFIVVKRDAPDTMTDQGLVIPEEAVRDKPTGVVVSSNILVLTKGTRIYFGSFAGEDIEVGGEEYLIISRDDVRCTLEFVQDEVV